MTSDPFDSDAMRRALELSEGPAQRLMRQMENDPATKMLRELENSPALQAAQMLEQNDIQKLMDSVTTTHAAFERFTRSQQWAEVSGAVAAAHSVLARPETFDALQRIDANLKHLVTNVHHAIVPLADQLQSFSIAAAQAIHPLHEHFQHMETWQTSLADRMAQLNNPWAFEDHLGVSVVGFARIARLHDISSGAEPFDPAGREVFSEELGEPVAFDEDQSPADREAAQIDAGLNAEVVAFPQNAYPHVLFSAGFELRIEAVAPVRTDRGEVGQYDPQHASLLGQIENRLRAVIETELQRIEGEAWLRRRVHGDLRKKWQDRKAAEHEQRGDSFPVLYYADFMELMHIIIEGRNWRDAFQRFFVSKEDFQVSMQRLAPVRNTIGHNRPLVRTDQLILLAEGTRILRALGVRM
ncbi:Swt1 family HEPN domain-containing protein [Sulfitobacter pontiacus]|uniref:Swt1 family HEPN domain-containing protein n=1 Tax=Sulfitobacter pontiacus TaxID=60137 RepID=UPI0030ED9891|tara:strand:- start:4007 stop:5242 length:1236 start_codon:yes stop_codon:yes gene_type:complete